MEMEAVNDSVYLAVDEIEMFNYSYDYFLEEVPSQVAALSILIFVGVVSSLLLLVTVLRNKTIRSGLTGVLLVNMAVATLFYTLVATRWLEYEASQNYGVFGTVDCHMYYIFNFAFVAAFNGILVVLSLDVAFDLPSNSIVKFAVTLSVWLISILSVLVMLYGITSGPILVKVGYDDMMMVCTLDFYDFTTTEFVMFLWFEVTPTFFIIAAFVKLCTLCGRNKSSNDKVLPLVISLITFLVLVWTERVFMILVHHGHHQMIETSIWVAIVKAYRMPATCLYWLFLMSDLRNTLFLGKSSDDESPLLMQ